MTTIRVLLVDDDPLICRYIAMILRSAADMMVVGMEHDGAAAVDSAVRLHPDVILMDIQMPGVDGVRATHRIRALELRCRVVALTVFDTDTAVLNMMRAGADGVLLKSTSPTDLVNVVRVAAQGQTVLSGSAARRLTGAATRSTRRAATDRLLAGLTEREYEVLALLAHGHGNAHIAHRLTVTEATIKGHVSRILDKLHCQNRTQAGLVARDAGLHETP